MFLHVKSTSDEEFEEALRKQVVDLAAESNVLCFQEINNSWRRWLAHELKTQGMKLLAGDNHDHGLCIFHDSTVTPDAVDSPRVFAHRPWIGRKKKWRRVTIASLQHRETGVTGTKSWVVSLHQRSRGLQNPGQPTGVQAGVVVQEPRIRYSFCRKAQMCGRRRRRRHKTNDVGRPGLEIA